MRMASVRARTHPQEAVAANLETGAGAERRGAAVRRAGGAAGLVEQSYDLAADPAAALNHDLAGRVMTATTQVPLSSIRSHAGRARHGGPAAPAAARRWQWPRRSRAPGWRRSRAWANSLLSPGLPQRVAGLVLRHTAG
ncbi:hypothetical protein GCM10020220_063220 [Nonomuraea rubra]|uniref:hypothetical protein n=1 Tax=Nonomuraea rubra TaxID=46180 RepID=UPI0031EF8860